MKAVLFRRFGGTEVLEWTDTEDPQPGPGEIRVWVCTGFSGAYVVARLLAPLRGRRVRLVTVKPNGQQLERIGGLMSEGKIEVVVERTFPITEIPAAQAESASGRVRGKIAITVA